MALFSYTTLSANFARIKDLQVSEVGTFIGGKVEQNIRAGVFKNACALRLSYAFNYSGLSISSTDGAVSSGKDKKWYLFRVSDMRRFVERYIGGRPIKGQKSTDFSGKKGIIIFDNCGWNDASGHIDLFDGKKVEGHGYWNDCTLAILYELK